MWVSARARTDSWNRETRVERHTPKRLSKTLDGISALLGAGTFRGYEGLTHATSDETVPPMPHYLASVAAPTAPTYLGSVDRGNARRVVAAVLEDAKALKENIDSVAFDLRRCHISYDTAHVLRV